MPEETAVVCPTREATLPAGSSSVSAIDQLITRTTSPWDVALVELLGVLGAALAAAATLRGIRGTSAPHKLLVALAVLKLPVGALTSATGILLIGGDFIPGFTSLDRSTQIVAWALVFGYAQQLITRFIDERAQALLGAASSIGTPRSPSPGHRNPGSHARRT